jgi:predicted nucleic acid-binding protein
VSRAYVDSSCIVAKAFREAGGERASLRMFGYEKVASSNLLEAEVRAAARREGRQLAPTIMQDIQWIQPQRALSGEICAVVEAGNLRGADAWHVACALWLAGDTPAELDFLTLDRRQADVAAALGLSVPELGAI